MIRGVFFRRRDSSNAKISNLKFRRKTRIDGEITELNINKIIAGNALKNGAIDCLEIFIVYYKETILVSLL